MDNNKTKEQLLTEVDQLRVKIAELEKNRGFFKLIAENTSDNISITTFDLKAKYIYISPSIKSVLGYDPEDLLGKSFFDFIHPEDKKVLFPILKKYIYLKVKKLLTGKDSPISKTIEFRFKNKAGNWCFTQSTVNVAGKQLLAVTRDITERKKTEEALRESEERLRLLIDNSPVGISITDLNGYFIEVNPALCNMTGYSRNEMISKHFNKFSHPDDSEKNKKFFKELVEGEIEYFDIEKRYLHKNGNIVNVLVKAQLIRDKKGKPLFQTAIIEDVTERKKAEEAIRESEEKYRTLYTSANDAIFLMQDYIITTCNPKTLEMFGCTEDEIVGHSPIEFSPEYQPDGRLSAEKAIEEMSISLAGETRFFEWVHQQKDGSPFNVEISLSKMMLSDGEYIQAIVRNITERKKAEQQLIRANTEVKESELKYKKFSDSTIEGIVFHENGIVIDVNYALQKMTGYTYEELIGQNIIQLLVVEKYHSVIAQNMDKDFSHPYQVEVIRKDGSIFPVELEGKNIKIKNKIIRVVAVRNVTERKLAEESLRASEEKFREMANMLPQIVYETDIDGNLTFVNEQGYEIFGYSKAEFENSFNVSWSLIPDDRDRVKADIRSAMYGKHVENSEYTALKKDGSTLPVLIYANAILRDNNPVGLRGIIVDITDRKKVEAELSKLSSAVQQSPSVIAITDLKGNLEYVNQSFIKLTGYTLEEAIGINPRILKSVNQPDEMYKELWETISSGKEWHGEFHNKKKNGEFFWEAASISPIIDKKGKIISYLKVAEDITQRKQAEEELKKKMNELEVFNDAAVDRELLVNDLRKEINKLLGKLGIEKKYTIVE